MAIAALDREGLRHKRMRLADLRGSSALQYEADVGLIFNNKYDIVSRETWSITSGRRGPAALAGNDGGEEPGRPGAVDMEYPLDAAHFRLMGKGGYVRDRPIDDRLTLA